MKSSETELQKDVDALWAMGLTGDLDLEVLGDFMEYPDLHRSIVSKKSEPEFVFSITGWNRTIRRLERMRLLKIRLLVKGPDGNPLFAYFPTPHGRAVFRRLGEHG